MKKVVIIFLAAVFMLAMYVPVSAADWDLYGMAKVNTFWTDYDEDTTFGPFGTLSGMDDTTQLDHNLSSVARIGGTVQSGFIGGHFEYGTFGGNANIRHLYGTVDMPFGELLVGQTWTPYGLGMFISGQAYADEEGMLPYVGYTHRRNMIQLSVEGFKFALVEPARVDFDDVVSGGDSEVMLPQLQASYDMSLADGISLHLAGAFQTYDLKGQVQEVDEDGDLVMDEDETPVMVDAPWDGETFNAFGVTANARFTMMDPIYINVGGFYAQNQRHLGGIYSYFPAELDVDDPSGIADTESFGGLLVIGTAVNEIGLELGAGYMEQENDNWTDPFTMMTVYANAKIPLTPDGNAFIKPEIGYYDYDTDADDVDLGDKMYAGLLWQVNF